jgi:hypothetical protein
MGTAFITKRWAICRLASPSSRVARASLARSSTISPPRPMRGELGNPSSVQPERGSSVRPKKRVPEPGSFFSQTASTLGIARSGKKAR